MWERSMVALLALCASCAPVPTAAPIVAVAPAPPSPAAGAGTCRAFVTATLVAGEERRAQGQACLEADGRWRIVEETPSPTASIAMAGPSLDAVGPDNTVYYPYDPHGHASSLLELGSGYGGGYGFRRHGFGRHRFFGGFGGFDGTFR